MRVAPTIDDASTPLEPVGNSRVLFVDDEALMRRAFRRAVGVGALHVDLASAGYEALRMARDMGPRGVHVAHVIVDGGINGDKLRSAAPARGSRWGWSRR